jgi:monoamine oxidase
LNSNTSGGVSSSDLPISNVVYPSWEDGDGDQHYILMASYSWAQDATRMSSLVKDYPCDEVKCIDDPLVALCLQNLAKLFNDPSVTYETLSKKYISHHAWSWSRDPWTAGAFALFGPGQFEKIYRQNFTSPVVKDDRLLIAGEALSVHHAWISGALDSVYYKILQWTFGRFGAQGAAQLKELGHGGKPGLLPAEVDETHLYWSVRLHRDHIPGEHHEVASG